MCREERFGTVGVLRGTFWNVPVNSLECSGERFGTRSVIVPFHYRTVLNSKVTEWYGNRTRSAWNAFRLERVLLGTRSGERFGTFRGTLWNGMGNALEWQVGGGECFGTLTWKRVRRGERFGMVGM